MFQTRWTDLYRLYLWLISSLLILPSPSYCHFFCFKWYSDDYFGYNIKCCSEKYVRSRALACWWSARSLSFHINFTVDREASCSCISPSAHMPLLSKLYGKTTRCLILKAFQEYTTLRSSRKVELPILRISNLRQKKANSSRPPSRYLKTTLSKDWLMAASSTTLAQLGKS